MATTQFPVSSATTTDWLAPAELRTLEAVCEALLPPTPPPACGRATDLGVATLIAEALSQQSPETRAQFKQLLGLMGRPLFGMLVMGRPRRFDRMSLAARALALRKMRDSSLPALRQGFQGL